MDEAGALHLAEQLRAELPALLPAGDVAAVGAALAGLLERGRQGEPAASQILSFLRGHPTLRRRANELVVQEARRSVVPPPGPRRLPLSPRFVCPNGDYEYFRGDISRPVPNCPHDGAGLVPGDQA